jgi:hypothetical protein
MRDSGVVSFPSRALIRTGSDGDVVEPEYA